MYATLRRKSASEDSQEISTSKPVETWTFLPTALGILRFAGAIRLCLVFLLVLPMSFALGQPSETKPRFRGLEHESFIYADAPFKECHASTLCETPEGVAAAWFGGTKEGNKDVCIWISRFDGLKWSAPYKVADGIQHKSLRYPCWNPVLYQAEKGPTLLFFKVGPNPREWWGELAISKDNGHSFEPPRRLPEGIDGPVRCKPMLLDDDSTLLCGSSTEYEGWRVHFEKVQLRSGIPVSTWERIGPINNASRFNAIQPTFLQHADGRIQALCRTRESVIVSTFTSDQGKTWSALQPLDLPNPNSGIESLTLEDGRHALVYNPLTSDDSGWGTRGKLRLALSSDGLSWKDVAELESESGAEFSYPAMIQSKDGKLHITYTWKRRRIKHLVLDPTALPN